jgi:O-methyltransferase
LRECKARVSPNAALEVKISFKVWRSECEPVRFADDRYSGHRVRRISLFKSAEAIPIREFPQRCQHMLIKEARMDYLDLLKKVLTGFVFPESADKVIELSPGFSPKKLIVRAIIRVAATRGVRLVRAGRFDPEMRSEGRDWPMIAYTMVGLRRLDNVQQAIETVIREDIPGDIIECGVWRGGCAIFMRAVLKAYGVTDRRIWAADSYEGLPKPNVASFPADKGYDLSENQYASVPLENVKQNFERFGLLDDQVKFIKGWFKDSLPDAPIRQLAVLRADGDLYESTMQILENLYDKVSPGGFIIVDDFNSWPPCKKAVTDFRKKRSIVTPIEMIDWTGVYWRVPLSP